MAGSRCAQNSILANEDLLDAVRGSDFGNELNNLGVVVAAVSANNEEGILGTLGDGLEEGGDEVLGIVLLLEDDNLLAETGAARDVSCDSDLPWMDNSRSRLLALCGEWQLAQPNSIKKHELNLP